MRQAPAASVVLIAALFRRQAIAAIALAGANSDSPSAEVANRRTLRQFAVPWIVQKRLAMSSRRGMYANEMRVARRSITFILTSCPATSRPYGSNSCITVLVSNHRGHNE